MKIREKPETKGFPEANFPSSSSAPSRRRMPKTTKVAARDELQGVYRHHDGDPRSNQYRQMPSYRKESQEHFPGGDKSIFWS
jgi:hypothetical protein